MFWFIFNLFSILICVQGCNIKVNGQFETNFNGIYKKHSTHGNLEIFYSKDMKNVLEHRQFDGHCIWILKNKDLIYPYYLNKHIDSDYGIFDETWSRIGSENQTNYINKHIYCESVENRLSDLYSICIVFLFISISLVILFISRIYIRGLSFRSRVLIVPEEGLYENQDQSIIGFGIHAGNFWNEFFNGIDYSYIKKCGSGCLKLDKLYNSSFISMEELIELDDNICSICLDEMEKIINIERLQCNHMFHRECLSNWMNINHSCPICRAKGCCVRIV